MRQNKALISNYPLHMRAHASNHLAAPLIWLLVCCFVFPATYTQGQSFENLDFEMGLPGYTSVDDALPYWTASVGGIVQTEVLSPQVLWDQAAIMMAWYAPPIYPMFGDLSVCLSGAGGTNAVLEQTALVPIDARSLRFSASLYGSMEPPMSFSVTLDGQPITIYDLGNGYGGNLSGQAGNVATLVFTAYSWSSSHTSILNLDSIYFSAEEIPLGPAKPISISREGTNIVLTVTGGIGASWCNIERLNTLTGTNRWTKVKSFSPPGLGTYLWTTPMLNYTTAFFCVSTEYPIPGF